MRYSQLAIPSLAIVCATVVFGQISHQAANDSYEKLLSIADRQVQAVNLANRDLNKISAINKEGEDFLSNLPLSEEEKTQFLFFHINQELLEVQKREIVLKMMLNQLCKRRVHPDQFQFFAQFLNRRNLGNIDDALFACLVTVEDNGTSLFSNSPSTWMPVLKSNLKPKYTGSGLLAEHLLETAQQEHWKPFGNSYLFDSLNVEEQTEITDAIRATQKRILAQRFIEFPH
ncbi:MAG: hypothetical protein ABSF60_01655 [Verrucomicrobiota bacterium]